MRKIISTILIISYFSTLFCFVEPVVEFYLNRDYIMTHLCESLTNPEKEDCDGYCYLKKQIKGHGAGHDDHSENHSATLVKRDLPVFLFISLQSDKTLTKRTAEYTFENRDTEFPDSVFVEVLSPPPQG